MMVVALAVDIGLHSSGKILNADPVRLCGLLAPVTGSLLRHEAHALQNLHDGVLNEVKILPGDGFLIAASS